MSALPGKHSLNSSLRIAARLSAQAHVVDENRHRDHVLQTRPADRLDGLVELGEYFTRLTFEIEVRRAGLAAEPDDLAAVGGDGARKSALLGARVGRVTSLAMTASSRQRWRRWLR